MKRLALLALMAVALVACENRVEKKEEIKTGTDVVQPAADKAPADAAAPADSAAPAENTAPAEQQPAQ